MGCFGTTWCNLTLSSYRELGALERRFMSLHCTCNFCFSLITQADVLCAPPHSAPRLLNWTEEVGTRLATELVFDNLLTALDRWVTVTVSISLGLKTLQGLDAQGFYSILCCPVNIS